MCRIRTALGSSGINASKYSGHSFRSGAAITALEAGISDVESRCSVGGRAMPTGDI